MKRISKIRRRFKFHPRSFAVSTRSFLATLLTMVMLLLTYTGSPASSTSANPSSEEAEYVRTRGKVRPGLEGQSTLEWVLIGGMLVVIIVGLLTTVFKPQLEAIITSILNTIQQNTTAK